MSSGLIDSTIGALNESLNLRLLNQNVIASNIANADTPGYKEKRVDFEHALRDALEVEDGLRMRREDENHMPNPQSVRNYPEVIEHPNDIFALDGNTVNRSEQMAKMAENQILYEASIEMLRKKLSHLKQAVTDGGGSR